MDYYINKILNFTNLSCNEYDIKKDIIDDLDLIFELYCDTHDTRLHEIYLKYNLENYIKLIYRKNINNDI